MRKKERINSQVKNVRNYLLIVMLIFGLLTGLRVMGQEITSLEISGKVVDEQNGAALPDVSVQIKNSPLGTFTNTSGEFVLRTKQALPLVLVFSSIGFQPQEFEVKHLESKLRIALITQTVLGSDVVISASRISEQILRSPVAIEKLDIRSIRETPSPGFYDALENVKGVQMTTSSLTFKVPNTRGFNIPNNFRFMQLTDGVDMQAATLGVPLGNTIGPTELDILSVEITPGAASALYGMNAINGMANLLTKNPFHHQGFSFYQKTGINHIDGRDHDLSLLTETAFRWAQVIHKRLAFKMNGSYMRGTDWVSNTVTDQNPYHLNTANPVYSQLSGQNNPAADAWNRYGDENNNTVTISGIQLGGSNRTFIVRRTGYWEKDVVNPIVDNLKFDGAVHFKPRENMELSYGYRVGKMDGVFQRGNKIQLDNVVVQNHRLELKGRQYFVKLYASQEHTGNSYNIKPLTDNLQLTHLSNNAWGARFKSSLQEKLDTGADLVEAMAAARLAADAGRVEPGTEAFDNLKNIIIGINNWDHAKAGIANAPATGGARLLQKSRTYHSDAQIDLSDKIEFVHILLGADVRVYEVIPDGNNFVDFSRPVAERSTAKRDGSFGEHVFYSKYGAFVQLTKTLFNDHLKLFSSLRFDYNPEFRPKFNPRLAAVYTLKENHNFRISVQNGFRFPALFEALSFVNNGNVRRVGGLSYINEGLGYLDNSYTLASVNAFNAAVNADVSSGIPASEAALKNRNRLEVTNLSPTRPERIVSFEAGYKAILFDKKFFIDIDAYSNVYDGFLGQVEVSVPNSDKAGTDAAVNDMLAANRSRQTRYRVFTNARNSYRNFGSSLGLTFNFYRKYTFSGNLNYNNIIASTTSDIFITAFNTPKWIANVSFGNREVIKNLGFNVVWKWQDAFQWESPLANGRIPAYQTFDAQVSYRLPTLKTGFKLGGTNVFNSRYLQYAAGPTIGGLYYLAVTVDGILNN